MSTLQYTDGIFNQCTPLSFSFRVHEQNKDEKRTLAERDQGLGLHAKNRQPQPSLNKGRFT
jgi:hypothetical protein